MSRIYFLLIFLLITEGVVAQNQPHHHSWSRLAFTYPLNEQWKLEADIMHRKQNNPFSEATNNSLQHDLLYALRFWAYYKVSKSITLSISPFAYFLNTPVIRTESDSYRKSIGEIRQALALEYTQPISPKIFFLGRVGTEYRNFQENNPNFFRGRLRLAIRYDMFTKWSLTFFDELFLNLNHLKENTLFEHNRIGCLLSYKPIKSLKIDLGYMYMLRKYRDTTDLVEINNFILHTYFNIFSSNKNTSKWK